MQINQRYGIVKYNSLFVRTGFPPLPLLLLPWCRRSTGTGCRSQMLSPLFPSSWLGQIPALVSPLGPQPACLCGST